MYYKFILLTIFAFLFSSCTEKCDNTTELQQIEMLKAELTTAESELENLRKSKAELDKLCYWLSDDYFELDKSLIAKVDNAFRLRTDLIPTKPVLGGTMYFSNVTIISTNWLMAEFEDGHIMGRAIYRYEISQDAINFKLLDKQGY